MAILIRHFPRCCPAENLDGNVEKKGFWNYSKEIAFFLFLSLFNTDNSRPVWGRGQQTNAEEIRRIPGLHSRTYCFGEVNDWFGVGTQVLHSSGWRADMTQPRRCNLDKCLPPENVKICGGTRKMYPGRMEVMKLKMKMRELKVGKEQ